MRKIAKWPPGIGTIEDTSFIDPKGMDEKDIINEHSHEHPDSFVPEKSVMEDQETITDYEGGVISPVDGVDYEVKLSYNNLGNKSNIEVYNDDGSIASFSCNVAKSMKDKIIGLQSYPTLAESAGLLFPYRRAEDVIYHMGTVQYPIDIIFVDDDSRIKKIYKNIQPGTLGTFGCANTKYVMEICGGLSDRLGISIGDFIKASKNGAHLNSVNGLSKITKELNIKKDIIIKYSNLEKTRFSNWNGYPILVFNTKAIVKTASPQKLITDLVTEFTNKEASKIYAFDFDGLIEESPVVRIYKTSNTVEDEVPYIRTDGLTVSIDKTDDGNEIYRDVHIYELASSDLRDDESIIFSMRKSFANFINNPDIISDATNLFKEIRKACSDKNSRILFLTRSPNPDYIKDAVCNRINLEFGDRYGLGEVEAIKIAKDSDASDIIDFIRAKFGNKDIKIYSDDSLLKRAGVPVPDDVKTKAKRIYKYLDMAERVAEESLENMENNLYEYEKIKDRPDVIEKSKGQYNQSVKAQTKVVKDFLIKTREAIRIFNNIKDISTTFEIIDSLASSAKTASESAEEIFDLVEKLDNPDFYMILSEKTDQYAGRIEDFKTVIERAKNYINTEILGLVILSA